MSITIFDDLEDLEIIGITKKEFKEDIKKLDEWGFDMNRNIILYLHETAEKLRYLEIKD